MRNFQVIRVKHKRADRDNAVLGLAADQGKHRTLVGQGLLGNGPQQAQFRCQGVNILLWDFGQFDAKAIIAVDIGNRLGSCLCRFGRRNGGAGNLTLRQRLQALTHIVYRILVHARPMMMAIHLHGQNILGHQESIHLIGGQRHFALADPVEQGLQHMGDFGDVGEAEGSRPALDGMRCPEDCVEFLAIRFGYIESQQQFFHFGEQFICLVEKNLVELAHVYRHFWTPLFAH
jgi:hypothetical protein